MPQHDNRPTALGQMSNWISNISTVWAVLVFLFPAVGAIVTAWLARVGTAPVPWHLVIFYASGVFAFLSFATTNLLRNRWEVTLKHKLTCDDFSVSLFGIQNKIGIILNCYLNNFSYMPIQVRLHDVSLILQGKTMEQEIDEKMMQSIAANGYIPLSWPLVKDIDPKQPVSGHLKFTADYGQVGKKLNRTLAIKFRVNIDLKKERDGSYTGIHMIGAEQQAYS